MLTKNDVGILERGTRVKVGDRFGTVVSVHEPEWIDHKTRAFRKELNGADISFDDEKGINRYVQADFINIAS